MWKRDISDGKPQKGDQTVTLSMLLALKLKKNKKTMFGKKSFIKA